MVSNQGDRSDGDNRDSSRPRSPRYNQSSRSKRDRYDQDSVDSGYGGSYATASPQSAKHTGSEGMRKNDADKGNNANNDGHDTDSDSDYDPKAKYYLTVDDNDYQSISFQGGDSSHQPESSRVKGKRRGSDNDDMTRRRRSNHDRHGESSSRRRRSRSASSSGSDSDSHRYADRPRRQSSRRYFDSSRSRARRDSFRRTLSPIMSEPSEDWRAAPEQRDLSSPRGISRSTRRRRASSAGSPGLGSASPEEEDVRSLRSSDKLRRSRTRTRTPAEKGSRERGLSEGGSSSYKGAADMEDAWYKTFKERITKGVDMNQVKKVGLDAAAVAAVKVAVGTQIPWKQRIPKTISVGLAAAVTDFLVSKVSIKPKGMVGTSK